MHNLIHTGLLIVLILNSGINQFYTFLDTSYLPIKQSHRFSNLSNFCNNSMVWSISTKFDTWPMSSCLKARLCHFKWFIFISDTFLELSDKFLLKYIQKSKKSLFVSWITLWLKSCSNVNYIPLFLGGQSYKFWN